MRKKITTVESLAELDTVFGASNRRQEVLLDAIDITSNDRNVDYDAPERNFEVIAQLWEGYLHIPINPHDVAVLNILQKVSRILTSPDKKDHWVDIAGYAACGYECTYPEA
jgi:hypothetical protein